MNKKIRNIIIIAVVVLVVIFAGLPILNRVIYHRSLSATMFAWQLHKDSYTTEEAFDEYLQEKSEENAQPYEIPEDAEITSAIEARTTAGGMQYYTLNLTADTQKVVVYFPGGSYIDQPRAVHWSFLDSLAQDTDSAFIVPIYPKLPDNDAQTAYAALTAFYDEVVADLPCSELVFMGDSAGGGMALSFAMQLRDAGTAGPDELILLCPWVDVTLTNGDIPAYEAKDPALNSEMLRHLGTIWAGDLGTDDPIISPLYGDLTGLGKVTLFTTTGELLYPDIMLLGDALADAGNDTEVITAAGVFHVWPLYSAYGVKEAQTTYAQIADLLK